MLSGKEKSGYMQSILTSLLLVFLLTSCGGGGSSGSTPDPAPTAPPSDSGGTDDPADGSTDEPADGPTDEPADDPAPSNPPETLGVAAPLSDNVGHPTLLSPHAKPIVVNGHFVYAVNTPADTLDVIDSLTREVVRRINVGVDPVGLAVRPDGKEVWVANHVSDTISVIDTDPDSQTLHHVKATVQAIDLTTLSTRFDEPTGIAFTEDGQKAYVALGPTNEIAVIDVTTYSITHRLAVAAQDPRAIVVRGNRLYVLAFESNNQTQLSGCRPENIDGDLCTFDAVEHGFTNNNVLSLNFDADIIKNPALPDRDLFVFDTTTDQLINTVKGIGTLLYGLTVDSNGRVYVAQTDARNDANGKAGTQKHGLAEMENRAFLNQITRVDCADSDNCTPTYIDLEPLPPAHPETGMALATPYGIQISDDNSVLVATAAGSNKLMMVDAVSGDILGRVDVGAVPRGVALESDSEGAPSTAWVLNVVDNSVSVVDVSVPDVAAVTRIISLDDPTPEVIKSGRMVFNDAGASTTGTFSCESCHPDGHADQLVWVLDTPICDMDGCTQIQPRLTMPVRGLRDTAPYHWDGIPGDPYGGINFSSVNDAEAPNCDASVPESCTLVLVDGGMGATMCDQDNCPMNDEGKAGAVNAAERDDLATFLLNVPYPPAQQRSFHNQLTDTAREGFFDFSFVNNTGGRTTGAQTCGDCHKMPFLVSTNTPGQGMEAPTWRGAYDRWMILPQARLNIIDLLTIVGMDDTFPEEDMWAMTGSTPENWEMVLQGSTGFSGGFARQVTINSASAGDSLTSDILNALESSAADGAVVLQGEGLLIDGSEVSGIGLEYIEGSYQERDGAEIFTRAEILDAAAAGELLLTLTGRAGVNVDGNTAQPALWPVANIEAQTRNVELAFLTKTASLRVNGRHIESDAVILLNGRKVAGVVSCESGTLPDCTDEVVILDLGVMPTAGGLHFLQVMNPAGMVSNDMMFFSEQQSLPTQPGNLIRSGGSFTSGQGQFDRHWNTIETATSSIQETGGEVRVNVANASAQAWHAQISHAVRVIGNQQYTLCYRAKADTPRRIAAYVDSNLDEYRDLAGGRFTANLNTGYQSFSHTFTATETDLRGRVAFDFAETSQNVQIDNIGLYEGSGCGSP